MVSETGRANAPESSGSPLRRSATSLGLLAKCGRAEFEAVSRRLGLSPSGELWLLCRASVRPPAAQPEKIRRQRISWRRQFSLSGS